MEYMAPSNISAGNVKIGIVVDSSASEEQADALAQSSGGTQAGSSATSLAVGEWTGVRRATVSLRRRRAVGSVGGARRELHRLPWRRRGLTTVSNAMFGFAPVFAIGQSSGTSEAFGEWFDASYGEAAAFEYA